MTPEEHYAEAERLLDLVKQELGPSPGPWILPNISAAQVHATLATCSRSVVLRPGPPRPSAGTRVLPGGAA